MKKIKNVDEKEVNNKSNVTTPHEENEDENLSDEDLEYFSTPGHSESFISSVQKHHLDGHNEKVSKTNKRKKVEVENEADYERVPRKHQKLDEDTNVKHLLPIKTKKGIINLKENLPEDSGHESAEEPENPENESAQQPTPEPLPALTSIELFSLRRQKLMDRKTRISGLASAIIENPHENIRKLRELRLMLNEEDLDVMLTVKKLVMISLMELFKDVIPGYRIRMPTQAEKQQQVKKETKSLWDFEESLLVNYRHYLEFLESTIKGEKKTKGEKRKNHTTINGLPLETAKVLKMTALQCVCELFVTHPHFNYRTNIVTLLVPLMDKHDKDISCMACNSVRRVFKEDRSGDVTLELVKAITKMVKTRHFKVHKGVLDVFLSLKIKDVNFDTQETKLTGQERKDMMRKLSRKDRKKRKKFELLEKELQETKATEDIGRKVKLQTETIQFVFLTYFRVLKEAQDSSLLPSVLEGLARFAHLINIDFFDDLFKVFAELIRSDKLAFRESLHCVQTAFTILSGHGSALNIDPNTFYSHLYSTLMQIQVSGTAKDIPLMVECLEVMLIKRKRQVSQQRVLAFVKRLATIIPQLPHQSALPLLEVLRQLIITHKCTELLFDNETQGSGVFLPYVSDPEHANANNTMLWELTLLQHHYHPLVKKYCRNLQRAAPVTGEGSLPAELSRKTTKEIYYEYCDSETAHLFKPDVSNKCKPAKKPKVKAAYMKVSFGEETCRVLTSIPDSVDKYQK